MHATTRTTLLGCLCSLALAAPAGAQPGTVEVSQIAPSAPATAPDAGLQVEAGPRAPLLTPAPVDPAAARRPVQQLSDGRPSAEAAPALSKRDQSRPLPGTAIGGTDRCDPAARQRVRGDSCEAVIEARSAEFGRAPPPLSPEQRLLLEQRVLTPAPGQDGTARRLAQPGGASFDDQAVASIALRQSAPPTASDKKEEVPGGLSQEQAAAIVGAILAPPK